ncbi:MAG: 50S ribosomal protein L3 [Cardiobacteriaceae bacterium]|nr:50S ribosomal protein L3 [Cardiobacteriaceae bacterium]
MTMGLVGQKLGMTRIFNESGDACAVTVIEIDLNIISQIKTTSTDGYDAVQVTTGKRKANHVTRGVAGHFSKANIMTGAVTKEFRVAANEISNYGVGNEISVSIFSEGERVDVRGRSVGKGFAGTIKRHHFSGQRKTHGNSLSHRVPGSIGQNQTPGRVFKGKKMSGHLGNKMRSTQNLEIVRVDAERKLLLLKGAVPGAKGAFITIRPSVKA